MQSRIEDFRAQDAEIIAVSVDPTDKLLEISDAYDLEYRLLSDPDLALIEAFGVRDATGGITGDAIARPATFVLDREGTIVWRDLTENWRVRVRPDRILEQLALIP